MEGVEKIASEQLAKLTSNSESEENKAGFISNLKIDNRRKQKLKEAKDITTSSDIPVDEKSKKLYSLLLAQAEATKKLETEAASIRKKTTNMQREKETLLSDINAYREHKAKLENFCREIKKKNDEIVKESKEIEETEKKKLEEIKEKMDKAIEEIGEKFVENDTEKNRLAEENKGILKQIEELREQALSRDQEYQNIIMEKNLEVQLLKVQVDYKNDFESEQLKTQLDLYKNKFGEFQSLLEKSSEAYILADSEIKKIDDKVNAELTVNNELKKAKEKFDIELIELYTEKNALIEENAKLKSRHDSLKLECNKLLQAKKNK